MSYSYTTLRKIPTYDDICWRVVEYLQRCRVSYKLDRQDISKNLSVEMGRFLIGVEGVIGGHMNPSSLAIYLEVNFTQEENGQILWSNLKTLIIPDSEEDNWTTVGDVARSVTKALGVDPPIYDPPNF